MTAPIILTERLRLDGHRADDLEALAAMMSDGEVCRFLGGPRGREEMWMRLLRAVGQWALLGYGYWIVRDRASGALLGEVGLMEAERDLSPALDAPEAMWVFSTQAQGHGFAQEALTAGLEWADRQGVDRTQCIIDPDNARSIALAKRAGYVAIGERPYRDGPVVIFERSAAA